MAETSEQWYTMLQETYDKWSGEVKNINLKIEEKQNSSEEFNEDEIKLLKKQIDQILPTLEKYKYYLDFKTTHIQQEKIDDLIQFD